MMLAVHGVPLIVFNLDAPSGSPLPWMMVFAAVSIAISTGWMWITVGYPGMYWPGVSKDVGTTSRLKWIRHELDIVKTLLQSVFAIYALI